MNASAIGENPFTPTFGEVPAHMAGRSVVLNDLKRALSSSKRHPNLTTIITGARGTGKTALLSLAAEEAEQRGWVAVSTVALPGMLDDILISTRRVAAHLLESESKAKPSSIEVGQLGVGWEAPSQPTNWRNEMTKVLDQLDKTNTGLLILVDEVQPNLPDMIQLAAVYQLLVMEGRKVALLMAGLPHNMLMLEADKSVSFLRRAQKCQLGRIADYDIENAMRKTIEEAGRTIGQDALDAAVRASDGFPFMMQLVGFRMWDQHPDERAISLTDAEAGIELARAELRDRIVRITYESISAGDKAFLAAMLLDEGSSKVTDIARRLGKTHSYATQYKNRLLGQGIIEKTPDGGVRFQLPLMREYVAEATAE